MGFGKNRKDHLRNFMPLIVLMGLLKFLHSKIKRYVHLFYINLEANIPNS